MSDRRWRFRLERLEERCVPSTFRALPADPAIVTGPPSPGTLVGDINGDGRVDTADEKIFADAYNTKVGDPKYNPAADLNHNGYVGQGDGKILLARLTNPPRYTPLRMRMAHRARPAGTHAAQYELGRRDPRRQHHDRRQDDPAGARLLRLRPGRLQVQWRGDLRGRPG